MNKIYIYHHNCNDGAIAAGILYNFLLDKEIYKDEDIIFNKVDHLTNLDFSMVNFKENDKVYFLDYIINSHNQNEFQKLLDDRDHEDDVIWIDHHITSINSFIKEDIPGIRNTSLCVSAWVYLYCQGKLEDCIDYLDSEDGIFISKKFHKSPDIPTILKYIDDYDCCKGLYPENDFYLGLQISDPKTPKLCELLSNV